MKKQLLTFFLTFTAVFYFITNTKPTNAELLPYLKSIEVVIKKELGQLSSDEKILQKKFKDYNVAAKILNEFFDVSLCKQQISKMGKLMFGLFCYKVRPIDSFVFRLKTDSYDNNNVVSNFFVFFPFDDSKEDENIFSDLCAELNINVGPDKQMNIFTPEDEAFIFDLMQTLVEKHFHHSDTRSIKEKMACCFGSEDGWMLSFIIGQIKVLTVLQQDINNKINEIEATS